VTRIAWLVCFVVPLLLLAILGMGKPAHALTVIGGGPTVDTAITGGPAEGATIDDNRPVFAFSADVSPPSAQPAVFRCAVDGGAPSACGTPLQLGPLSDGTHTFSVLAEDPESGAFDESPATRGFVVDTSDPVEVEEECFEEGEGAEEECEAEADDTSPFPPEECLLRTARARVFAYTAHDRVRLVIRYTSLAPAQVSVDYWMKGRKGPLSLGHAKQRFAKKGLFRLAESFSAEQMEKVRAAKGFTVTMRIPAAPKYCNQYYSRHLTIKRTIKNQVLWFQSDSIFGTTK
jgi:hypothetical protein